MKKQNADNKMLFNQLKKLGLPIFIQSLVSTSLSFADTIMVGKVSQNALAGVSLANTPFFIAMLFIFGLQSGGAVLISQYWGKKDITTINRILGISIFFGGILAFLFATTVFLFPQQVMGLVTNNQELLTIAADYGKIVSYSYLLNSVVMVYVAAQRSIENPKFGLVVLSTSMVANVFMNWVLIFGKLGFPAMGVKGAALATLLSRAIELVITIIYMKFFDKRLPIIPKAFFHPGKVIVKDFIKYSTPVILNETLWGLGTAMFPVIYGHMANSADIVAAFSISGNVERIVRVTIMAISHAGAVMIGKEVGRGASRDDVYNTGTWVLRVALISGVFMALLLVALALFVVKPVLFPFLDMSQNSEQIAINMLYVGAAFMLVKGFNGVNIVGVLRGGGDVRMSMFIDVIPLYLYAVPVAALSALVFKADIMIVYLLINIEELIKIILGAIRIRSRKWINNLTREQWEIEA